MIDSNVSSVETPRLKKHTIMLEQGTINYIKILSDLEGDKTDLNGKWKISQKRLWPLGYRK